MPVSIKQPENLRKYYTCTIAMATGNRLTTMQPTQQQRCAGFKYIPARARHFMWTFFLAFLLLGCIVSQEFLYSLVGNRNLYGIGGKFPVSEAASLLKYSESNSAIVSEREKIKFLLEKTELGKISIRDVIYRKFLGTSESKHSSSSTRREKFHGKAWMFPLTSRVFDRHVPKFFQLAKTWVGDGDFDPAGIMQDLVQTVKRPLDQNAAFWARGRQIDGLASPLLQGRDRYQTCAVVGNSGILLNGSYGEQIDSNEMVIRLNNADIFLYKDHAGSKTTLSFMNSNVFRICSVTRSDCWCHPYGDEVPIVLYICQAQHLMHVAMCIDAHKSPLLVTHSLLDALCAAIAKWYSMTNFVQTTGRGIDEWDAVHHSLYFHYSSGMQAVVLALGICDRVDIFGFGKFPHAKHHYHTAQKKELNLHDYEAEYVFYDDLVHNRTIPFLSDAGFSLPSVRIFY